MSNETTTTVAGNLTADPVLPLTRTGRPAQFTVASTSRVMERGEFGRPGTDLPQPTEGNKEQCVPPDGPLPVNAVIAGEHRFRVPPLHGYSRHIPARTHPSLHP
jgi:hypothetical protein